MNSVQNQPQNPGTNPLARFNHTQSYNQILNHAEKNQNQLVVQNNPDLSNRFAVNTITHGPNRTMSNSLLSRPPLITLNAGDSYSLTSTNPNNNQTKTTLNATYMNPQTLYQPHTAPLQQIYQPNYTPLQTVPNIRTCQNTSIPCNKYSESYCTFCSNELFCETV